MQLEMRVETDVQGPWLRVGTSVIEQGNDML